MKAVFMLAFAGLVASQANDANFVEPVSDLDKFYNKFCQGRVHSYTTVADDGTSTTTYETHFQPWEFLLGYALGTQVYSEDETSTCYGQVLETYKFIDVIAAQTYDIMNKFSFSLASSQF